MVVVGRDDIGSRGFNADMWVHERHAYMGRWGFPDWCVGVARTASARPPRRSGVAVIDARDAQRAAVVSKLRNPEGTSVEDVVV